MSVKVKAEIVTMGQSLTLSLLKQGQESEGESEEPTALITLGTYVEPASWNALIADPDTVVVDTRMSR